MWNCPGHLREFNRNQFQVYCGDYAFVIDVSSILANLVEISADDDILIDDFEWVHSVIRLHKEQCNRLTNCLLFYNSLSQVYLFHHLCNSVRWCLVITLLLTFSSSYVHDISALDKEKSFAVVTITHERSYMSWIIQKFWIHNGGESH